jgi:hypothetical protein
MPPALFIPSASAMRIEYGDETWWLDVEHVTTRQAKEIYKFIGMPILRLFKKFGEIVKGGDGDDFEDSEELYNILICLYWLMRCQCGVREPLADADMELVPFLTALMQAMLASSGSDGNTAAAGEEPALPPTLPGGPPSPAPPTRPATTRSKPSRRQEVVSLPSTG